MFNRRKTARTYIILYICALLVIFAINRQNAIPSDLEGTHGCRSCYLAMTPFFPTFEFCLLLRGLLGYLDCFLISQVPEVARAAAGSVALLWRMHRASKSSHTVPSVICLLYFIRCSGCLLSRHLLECTNYVTVISDGFVSSF